MGAYQQTLETWSSAALYDLAALFRAKALSLDEPRKIELLDFMAGKFAEVANGLDQDGPAGRHLSLLV